MTRRIDIFRCALVDGEHDKSCCRYVLPLAAGYKVAITFCIIHLGDINKVGAIDSKEALNTLVGFTILIYITQDGQRTVIRVIPLCTCEHIVGEAEHSERLLRLSLGTIPGYYGVGGETLGTPIRELGHVCLERENRLLVHEVGKGIDVVGLRIRSRCLRVVGQEEEVVGLVVGIIVGSIRADGCNVILYAITN